MTTTDKPVQIISAVQSKTGLDVWRVTINGYVLGDSRGYAKMNINDEIDCVVRRDPTKNRIAQYV